jgi:hypothetical protein
VDDDQTDQGGLPRSDCGNNCALVCESQCGSPVPGRRYSRNSCSNAGGGTCKGAIGLVAGEVVTFDTGPCCKCKPDICASRGELFEN